MIRNPSIFQHESLSPAVHSISELTIANACLLYLSQDRYSQLLKNQGDSWTTASNDEIRDHHLLTYSAKYWDKHFDSIEETPERRLEIEGFLTSSNFITTMQLQSLFVQGHFINYTLVGASPNQKFTKRVFPKWFASHGLAGRSPFSRNYRSYISEWHNLLECKDCEETHCYRHSASKQFSGQIDRCLWGALGPGNFLSSHQGRYTSFMMCNGDTLTSETKSFHGAVSHDGNKVVVLQSPSRPAEGAGAADSTFLYGTWSLMGQAMPHLLGTKATISTCFDSRRWIDADMKSISFTSDLGLLRIGSQLFSADNGGEYRPVDGLEVTSKYPKTCFEDIISRGSLLVAASRRKMPAPRKPRGRKATKEVQSPDKPLVSPPAPAGDSNLGRDLSATDCRHSSGEDSKSNHGSDTSLVKEEDISENDGNDSESSYPTDETSEWNSAEESWSEGSTEVDELGNLLTSSDESSSDSSEADVDSEEESETTAINSYDRMYEESDSDGGDIDFDCGSDSDAYDGDHDDERLARSMAYGRRNRKRGTKVQQGVLTIYDLAGNPPNQLFTFTHPLPIMLYESPPAIHPTKPLVVWPLSGGDVLFADFKGKSYFVRRARTTTRKSGSSICLSPVGFWHLTKLLTDLFT